MRALALVTLVLSLACGAAPTRAAPDATATPTTSAPLFAQHGRVVFDLTKGKAEFAVELAFSDAEHEHGLMFREHLDDDAGMLFVFSQQQHLAFWMKNTLLALDMVFVDDKGVVVGVVENAEPLTLTPREVKGDARFVLELNGGTARKRGIRAGQHMHIEGALIPPVTTSTPPPASAPPAKKAP